MSFSVCLSISLSQSVCLFACLPLSLRFISTCLCCIVIISTVGSWYTYMTHFHSLYVPFTPLPPSKISFHHQGTFSLQKISLPLFCHLFCSLIHFYFEFLTGKKTIFWWKGKCIYWYIQDLHFIHAFVRRKMSIIVWKFVS